ncbi:MAG: TrkH family potassium uptake protein, partial [Candidatus Altiarchaeales archaeon]|nr:TrkH family potassium uptake protein [Candidatus Altiarchaeales archaeon]
VFGNFRTSLFQAVSILTTTGFGTADIAYWPALAQTLLLLLMLIGGSYGSTGSGIKVLRVVVIIKTIGYSIKKIMLPKSAMVRLKVAENSLNYDEITNVFAFFTAYLIIVFLGACIVAELGYGGYESLSISLSAMSNVGPTYLPLFIEESDGSLQPNPGWFEMPDVGKITLILLMWIGRLEIFPALIIFTGFFRMKKKKG